MIELDAIHAGLHAGEFYLEYIPTIMLSSRRCVGAEALVRWRRPSGIVMPLDFIPLVENTPLSGVITYWVIERAAAELGDWLRQNPSVHLSINVPPEILGRGGVEYAASKAGLKDVVNQIVLEVTERGVPDKLGIEALNNAVRQGARIALDDVNVTGANMVVLSRCDVQIIKLDKPLIAQLAMDAPPPKWLAALSALLASTKFEVIAEGVETAEQVSMLQAAGVNMAQGYYFSRPIPAGQFIAFFQQSNDRLQPHLLTLARAWSRLKGS
jgi:sensor c-di-GMP phosphodiesterase-like protein